MDTVRALHMAGRAYAEDAGIKLADKPETLDGAGKVGLPTDRATPAKRVLDVDAPRLAAALVRVSLDRDLAEAVRAA
jgi:hypothetical protein